MIKATPLQVRQLWSFCVRHGSEGHDHERWSHLNNNFVISKDYAERLLSSMRDFEQEPTPELKSHIETEVRNLFPGFRIVRGPLAEQETPPPGGEAPPEQQDSKEEKPEEIKTSPGYVPPPEFRTVLKLVRCGVNVLLTGPAGCGKSRLARELAVALDLPLHEPITFGGNLRYPQIFGSTRLVVRDGVQVSEFELSLLLRQIQQPGVQVIDEIFSCESDVTNGLNGLLEPSTRAITTPAGVIRMHPDCVLIGTANTNGRTYSAQYTGVSVQDFSLLDRFVEVKMTYDTTVEAALLSSLEPEAAKYVARNLNNLRRKVEANNIAYDPSTRRLISCIKMIQGGFAPKAAFDMVFINPLSQAEKLKVGA